MGAERCGSRRDDRWLLRAGARAASMEPVPAGRSVPRGSLEQVGQHRRLADVAALRRGQQGEPATTGQLRQVVVRGAAFRVVELCLVPTGELVEPFGVMAVPLAQFGGRGDLFAPVVEFGALL